MAIVWLYVRRNKFSYGVGVAIERDGNSNKCSKRLQTSSTEKIKNASELYTVAATRKLHLISSTNTKRPSLYRFDPQRLALLRYHLWLWLWLRLWLWLSCRLWLSFFLRRSRSRRLFLLRLRFGFRSWLFLGWGHQGRRRRRRWCCILWWVMWVWGSSYWCRRWRERTDDIAKYVGEGEYTEQTALFASFTFFLL